MRVNARMLCGGINIKWWSEQQLENPIIAKKPAEVAVMGTKL
jgi:hypothetical protein